MSKAQTDLERAELERDLWQKRYSHLMGWVEWLREDVCHFEERASLRLAQGFAGLNRMVGTEDLFMASLEIQKTVRAMGSEVNAAQVVVVQLADFKDRQFRSLALKAAEDATESGRARGQET